MRRNAFAAFLLAQLLAACAPDSRLLKPDAAGEALPLAIRAEAADGFTVTLRHRIGRDGPGSWVREAGWDEYVLAFDNRGAEPVTVREIGITNDVLPEAKHSTQRENLESESVKSLEAMKTAGLASVVGVATVSTALTGAFLAAGWTVVTPAAPIALLAGGVMAYRGMSRRSQDAAIIDHQLERRGLRLPAAIGARTEVGGSAFFPITPAATRMRVLYTSGGSEREIYLELSPV